MKQNKKLYYIVVKPNMQSKKIYIYVTLLKDTKINNNSFNINFLLTITEEYPQNPPLVQCQTNVYK